jgi:DNA-binding NarL/FixJ family response regulator
MVWLAVPMNSRHRGTINQMATTVLIVDDHSGFRLTARTLLESEGYEVIGEAETGVQALKLARELHPDLVLLDVQLPDFDGFEVAARMLATENGDGPKIILTSSRDGSDFGPLVGQCGASGFVPKAELSGVALARLIS